MYIQHMQKALVLMNIRLHEVISQINGVSGLRVVEAIIGGERNPHKLVELCDGQILSRKRERVLQLRGDVGITPSICPAPGPGRLSFLPGSDGGV